MIGAILRAQLLSMRMRVGTRRASAVFTALTSLLFYGFWTFLAIGVLAWFSNPDNAGYFAPALSTGLFFAMLYWQLVPVITAGFGASVDLRKLRVYPIPHRKLFFVEVLLRITNGAEMLLLLAGATAGLLRNPLYAAGAKILMAPAAVLFATTNVLLSAGLRHSIERMLRRTRVKEFGTIVFILVALLPQLLFFLNIRKGALVRLAPSQIFWPWGAIAHIMLGDRIALAALAGVGHLGLAYWFGRHQFERSIRRDDGFAAEQTAEISRPAGFRERLYRFPSRFLRDPIAAVVEKELRTLFRIPRFRMVYGMSAFFGIVLYLPMYRNPRGASPFLKEHALTIMALYGLLMMGPISYWNAFGFDRTAVQGYFSWPIKFRDALIGKNITVMLLLVPQVVVIALFERLMRLIVTPRNFIETVAVILIASLYWFGIGNIFSVRIPRAMDPEKMNQMSNKMQALSIWTAPLLLLPIVLAYWARMIFDSELIFTGVLLIAGVIGAIVYYVGLDSAVNIAEKRRESIVMELGRAEGPLSIT